MGHYMACLVPEAKDPLFYLDSAEVCSLGSDPKEQTSVKIWIKIQKFSLKRVHLNFLSA